MSLRVRVVSLGRFAQAALASGEARVIAVFERSCYVEAATGLACVGVVGNGPLNAHCGSLPQRPIVGEVLRVNLQDAAPWRPHRAPGWDAEVAARSLVRLQEAARAQLPSEGFGFLIDPTRARPPAVVALARWLANPAGTPAGAAALIGLGPGLTPAGDDLIGGALCALHAAGRSVAAARLAAWALPLALGGTNRISQAHVACAAEGECGEAVNGAIVALLSGEPIDLARIDAIGHTSGWDALAGAVLALRALQES